MKRVVVEPGPGGAIYTEQEDGTNCPWASVLSWDPPHRFVMAWQVSPTWQYEPDPSLCSEVEVRFTPADDGTTLVELEHRNIDRHGPGWEGLRDGVDSSSSGASPSRCSRAVASSAELLPNRSFAAPGSAAQCLAIGERPCPGRTAARLGHGPCMLLPWRGGVPVGSVGGQEPETDQAHPTACFLPARPRDGNHSVTPHGSDTPIRCDDRPVSDHKRP